MAAKIANSIAELLPERIAEIMDGCSMQVIDSAIPNTNKISPNITKYTAQGFIIGFLIYIPFIVIDMVIASTLMSMGMMMLPPTTISMPFKILLFVVADGWSLVIGQLVNSFYG